MNRDHIFKIVIDIAIQLDSTGKTMTFDQLATEINKRAHENYSGGRGIATVVSLSYDYAINNYNQSTANIVANVYRDRNGEFAYK